MIKEDLVKEFAMYTRWEVSRRGINARYREKHRAHIIELREKYYKENREHALEKGRIWRLNNPELVNEYQREWRKTEKGRACNQRVNSKRRAIQKEIINTLTSQEWLDILEDYNYKCAYCGKDFSLSNRPTKDHIIPLDRGGDNTRENVRPACKSCNSKKGTQLVEEILLRFKNRAI